MIPDQDDGRRPVDGVRVTAADLAALEEYTNVLTYERALADEPGRREAVALVVDSLSLLLDDTTAQPAGTAQPGGTQPGGQGESAGPDEHAELAMFDLGFTAALAVIDTPLPASLLAFLRHGD